MVVAVFAVRNAIAVVAMGVATATAVIRTPDQANRRAAAVVGWLAVTVLVDVGTGTAAAAATRHAAEDHAGSRIGLARDQLALGAQVLARTREHAERKNRDQRQ